jgi:AraC-like DNA-binding protein
MNYVYSAIAGLILFFILLILRKKDIGSADYLLIALNITLGLFLLSDVLVHWQMNSFTLIFQNSVPLLLLPIFMFFALQYTYAHGKIPLVWYGLYFPLILMVGVSITDHFILHTYNESEVMAQFNDPPWLYQVLFKGSQILFIGVLIRLLQSLKSFDYQLKNGYSTVEEFEVKWLANFTRIYLYTILMAFVLFLSQNFGLLPYSVDQVYAIIYGVLIIAILSMTYQGMHHYTLDQVIAPNSLVGFNVSSPSLITDLEFKTNTSEKEQELELQMQKVLEVQKLYLNPQLSLKDLADSLNESTHFVSKVINTLPNRSFYDLINQNRVNHLKLLLDNPKNDKLTILALGLDSGFNSKASLNRIFKKHTDLTPKQYWDERKVK